MSESVTIDGFGPVPVRRPGSAAELGGLVREAAAAGQGLYPVGGRTMFDLGLPPTKPGFAVDTTGLNGVIDYPARDMTITVQIGITVGKLQEVLAAEHQWLPVDVPQPGSATIGGAVATNASGPRRFGYGTLRDYVIGISFVTDEGVEVKGGGRVVKNVAGYDLMKLHTGALGTLGVITQVTLKVRPRPEEAAAVVFGCGPADVGALLDSLHASKSRPVAVGLLNAAAWRAASTSPPLNAEWVIAAGFEEKRSTVAWQVATLLGELKATAAKDVTDLRGADADRIWSAVTGLQARPESRFLWKASVLPSKVADVVRTVPVQVPYLVHAEALNGIVWFHAPDGFPADPHDSRLPWMEQRISAAGGNYVMRRCPAEWKKTLRVWGRPTDSWELMRQVKRALDPNNVFNPGRLFADG